MRDETEEVHAGAYANLCSWRLHPEGNEETVET